MNQATYHIMSKLRTAFLLVTTLTLTSGLGAQLELKGKWLAELADGYILFLDFKDNEVLTVGQIENPKGPLQINKYNGKWRLEGETLKLRLPDLNQILVVENIYLDSIVFAPDESNDISIKKLVPIFNTKQDHYFNIEEALVGKQMVDSYHNSYEFFSNNKFIFSKFDTENTQDKKWYVSDFEGTELLILGEIEWFAARIAFIPYEKTNREIGFRYYYHNNIADFILKESKPTK